MHSLLNINKSQKRDVFCSFLKPKMLLLAGLKVPLQSEMTDFPPLSYSWNSKFPTLPYEPKKGNSFGAGPSLIDHFREYLLGILPTSIYGSLPLWIIKIGRYGDYSRLQLFHRDKLLRLPSFWTKPLRKSGIRKRRPHNFGLLTG